MPQIKFSGLVTAMKGKAGGSIFSQNKQGAYFRNNRWGGGRKSARWDAAKNRLQTMSNAWRLLTAEQREAWQAAAVNYPFENKFKEEYIPSGYQLFMSLNGTLFAQGLPTLTVPAEKRPFPEDVQISVATPDVPWVTGGTGATNPGVSYSASNACYLNSMCPEGFTCINGSCVNINPVNSPAYNQIREQVRKNYYMFGDPECTSDQDCYDAGLGTGNDIACTDGKCVYVGDGLLFWERTSYVLNIEDILADSGQWNAGTEDNLTQINGSFRFTLGAYSLRTLLTTQEEIILVSNYSVNGTGPTIRIRPQDQTTTRLYITFPIVTGESPSGAATFVWYQDYPTASFKDSCVLQFKMCIGNTVQNFMCLNNSGFSYSQFEYWNNVFSTPISEWGDSDGAGHNPFSTWDTTNPWTGFIYGAGTYGRTTDVIYSDIRFFNTNNFEFKYALSGMLTGSEVILITANGDVKPRCGSVSCEGGIMSDCNWMPHCDCYNGKCKPYKHIKSIFANKAPGGDTTIKMVAAVPVYNLNEISAGVYEPVPTNDWLNLMGGAFANNGATFVPLTLATIQGTTESGFQLIVSVSRAKGKGMTTRKTEFIDMTLLPADISAEWELWEFVKAAIASAPPGTEFWVAFNLLDTNSGLAQCRTKKTIRFKAGADLSSSVN